MVNDDPRERVRAAIGQLEVLAKRLRLALDVFATLFALSFALFALTGDGLDRETERLFAVGVILVLGGLAFGFGGITAAIALLKMGGGRDQTEGRERKPLMGHLLKPVQRSSLITHLSVVGLALSAWGALLLFHLFVGNSRESLRIITAIGVVTTAYIVVRMYWPSGRR